MKRVEKELNKISSNSKRNLRAHFCCALTLCYPTGKNISFEGKVLWLLTISCKRIKWFWL